MDTRSAGITTLKVFYIIGTMPAADPLVVLARGVREVKEPLRNARNPPCPGIGRVARSLAYHRQGQLYSSAWLDMYIVVFLFKYSVSCYSFWSVRLCAKCLGC